MLLCVPHGRVAYRRLPNRHDMTAPHLLVDISAHGLGHLAQTAPVLAGLRQRYPTMRLTVQSALPRERLARRIAEPFEHIQAASDFGFVMHNAVDIDYAASAARYVAEHHDWPQRVAEAADALCRIKPDLIFANAAYLPLAAAAKVGLPVIGMCSLNWADLFSHAFADEIDTNEDLVIRVHREIIDAYNAARVFLRVTPGLPMGSLRNRRDIGPIAQLAPNLTSAPDYRRQERMKLAQLLGLNPDQRWLLIAMGGMDFRLPLENWPLIRDTQLLCPLAWAVDRPDTRAFDPPGTDLPFTDLLALVDAVLTKPGYGTFVEAACNGVPLLYVPRDDWPEEEHLVAWMHQNARCAAVERSALFVGDIGECLDRLLGSAPPSCLPLPSGISDAVDMISGFFAGHFC